MSQFRYVKIVCLDCKWECHVPKAYTRCPLCGSRNINRSEDERQ